MTMKVAPSADGDQRGVDAGGDGARLGSACGETASGCHDVAAVVGVSQRRLPFVRSAAADDDVRLLPGEVERVRVAEQRVREHPLRRRDVEIVVHEPADVAEPADQRCAPPPLGLSSVMTAVCSIPSTHGFHRVGSFR